MFNTNFSYSGGGGGGLSNGVIGGITGAVVAFVLAVAIMAFVGGSPRVSLEQQMLTGLRAHFSVENCLKVA